MTSTIADMIAMEQASFPDQSLLQQLRQATYSSHRRIEQNARLARLLAKDLSRAEYQEVLARLLGFVEPLEERLQALPEAPLIQAALGKRTKAPWLVRDLLSLGSSPEAIASIPRASDPDLPAVRSLAEAAGVLYVLEGSTLGGQLISRHLAQSLGVTPGQGGSFYGGYGPDHGRMWSQFRHWLARLGPEECPVRQATAAAVQTFESLDRWLSPEEFGHG